MLWIGSSHKFFQFVVGFNNQVVGFCHERTNLFCNVSAVGYERKSNALALHTVPHAVETVVRDGKRSNGKVAYLLCLSFLNISYLFGRNLLLYTPVPCYSLVDCPRRVDRNGKTVAYAVPTDLMWSAWSCVTRML